MSKFQKILLSICAVGTLLAFTGCDLLNLQNQVPTRTKMEGIWQVTAAYDDSGKDIRSKIDFPITLFHLNDDMTFESTGGPMFMYIVYGGSKYTEISTKVDAVFNYANLNMTNGMWTCSDGTPDSFTIEINLKGLPGQTALLDLLNTIGVHQLDNILDNIIFHRFINVGVAFDSLSDSVMTWTFDNRTTTYYHIKDKATLNDIPWSGWNFPFTHCTFVLTKKVKGMTDLVNDAVAKNK